MQSIAQISVGTQQQKEDFPAFLMPSADTDNYGDEGDELDANDWSLDALLREVSPLVSKCEPITAMDRKPSPSRLLGIRGLEILEKDFVIPDFVIHGLPRGHVGQLIAKPNTGKSKFLRNLALSLATGREYLNLLPAGEPRRVAFLDFEDDEALACIDIKNMVSQGDFDSTEADLVRENLLIVCGETIDDDPLSLSKKDHLNVLSATLRNFKPDFLIVDTLAAAFEYTNENDNSEMIQSVMKPLKKLAMENNAAVLVAHHTGKRGENGVSDSSHIYSGRGASSVAGFVRASYELHTTKNGDAAGIKLTASKIKGRHLEDVDLSFDSTGKDRWFRIAGNSSVASKPIESDYDKWINLVLASQVENGIFTTKVLNELAKDFTTSKRTVENWTDKAVNGCALTKIAKGQYQIARLQGV